MCDGVVRHGAGYIGDCEGVEVTPDGFIVATVLVNLPFVALFLFWVFDSPQVRKMEACFGFVVMSCFFTFLPAFVLDCAVVTLVILRVHEWCPYVWPAVVGLFVLSLICWDMRIVRGWL